MTDTLEQLRQRLDSLLENRDGPVPKPVIVNFLFGAMDKDTGMPAAKDAANADKFSYLPEKIARILDVAEANFKHIDSLPSYETPRMFATGGGPGSGKSTRGFQFLAKEFGLDNSLAEEDWKEPSLHKVMEVLKTAPLGIVAPDRKELLQLAILDHGTPTSDKPFYDGHRAATNFLSLSSFNALIAGQKDFLWDTTLGSAGAVANLEHARTKGYESIILPTGAPLATREEAVDNRNVKGAFFQSLQFNLAAQESGFREAFPGIVRNVNELRLSWRDAADKPSIEVAVIVSGEKVIEVVNRDGFNKFRELYPQVDALGYDEVAPRPSAAPAPRILRKFTP